MQVRRQEFEVVVLGAGAAGVAAAVAAARRGCSVALVEKYGFFGGQAVSAQVGTLCGLYTTLHAETAPAGAFSNEFRTRLLAKDSQEPRCFGKGLYFLPYQAHCFEEVCEELLSEAGVSVFLHSTALLPEPTPEGEQSARQVPCQVQSHAMTFVASSYVDASGEGVLTQGAQQLREANYQAPGYVWGVSNIDPRAATLGETAFSKHILSCLIEAAHEGLLPKDMSRSTIVPGSYFANSLSLKLAYPFARQGSENELTHIERVGRAGVRAAFSALLKKSKYFIDARLSFVASQAGVRSAPRGCGQHVLSGDELRGCSRFPTAVAQGLWPMERWDANRKAQMEYFADGDVYQIPAEALCAKGDDRLFFAGRGISADEEAISSARVIGTCLATGYAAGALAAGVARNKARREVIAELQAGFSAPLFMEKPSEQESTPHNATVDRGALR